MTTDYLVPTLRVGMPSGALCAVLGTPERPDLHSTRSVERVGMLNCHAERSEASRTTWQANTIV